MQSALQASTPATPAPITVGRLPSIRFLAVAIVVLLLSSIASAITVRADTSDAPPAPAPFVALDARFSAVFPATPKRQDLQIDEDGFRRSGIGYAATTTTEDLAVASIELSFAPTGDQVTTTLDRAVDNAARRADGTVVSRNVTAYRDSLAEDAVFTTPTGVFHTRVVVVGFRLYTFVVITALADTPHPAYDRLLSTFQLI